jgi:hypothetical protein
MFGIVHRLKYIQLCDVSEAESASFISSKKGKYPTQMGLLELSRLSDRN